jgi:hypothetical protein
LGAPGRELCVMIDSGIVIVTIREIWQTGFAHRIVVITSVLN